MPFLIRPSRRFSVQCPVRYNAGPFLKRPLAYFWGFASLITLLVLSSAPACAEWVEVGDTGPGVTVYVNPDTIRRKGDLVKMWHLLDNKISPKRVPEPYLSMKGQNHYDCAEERTRKLFEMYFSGNMGRGEQLYTNSDETRWEPIVPGSIGQVMWKFACGKK